MLRFLRSGEPSVIFEDRVGERVVVVVVVVGLRVSSGVVSRDAVEEGDDGISKMAPQKQ